MKRSPARGRVLAASLISLGVLSLAHVPLAGATPFTSDLSVTTAIEFDSSYAGTATGTQTGSMQVRAGGAETSTSYAGAVATGSNPLTGTPTDLGDGFGIRDANASAGATETFAVGIGSPTDAGKMFMRIQNNSAAVGYHVVLKVSFDHSVDSAGTNAYSDSEFSLSDGMGEFFFTDLVSDTINGNTKNGFADPGTGGLLTDAGTSTFGYDINPGDLLDLHGFWTLAGGSFDGGATASSFFDVFFSIDSVSPLNQPPNPVPVPGTLALLGLGLGLLARARARDRGAR